MKLSDQQPADEKSEKKRDDQKRQVGQRHPMVDDPMKAVSHQRRDDQKIYRNFDPTNQIGDRVPSTSPL